jgi:hypothetical protein
VPDWKIEKYGATVFSKSLGRTLSTSRPAAPGSGEAGPGEPDDSSRG